MNVLVESSGALEVGERITFAYDGSFSGAYRDIPLRDGESISDVQVLEDRRAYTSGGCTELGCFSPPGTFGVTNVGDGIRVVWHYSRDERAADVRARRTGSRGSRSPTTTWSTSTSGSGATSGSSSSAS